MIKHVENVGKFGLPAIVAINRFPTDSENEVKLVENSCNKMKVKAILAEHWAKGGEGATELAKEVVRTLDEEKSSFKFLYPDKMSLVDKVRTVAQKIYGADDISIDTAVSKKFSDIEDLGFGSYPVCMAKTQYSFSTDPTLKCVPNGFTVPVQDVRLSAGAEFVVVLTGSIMTMPGLPSVPAAESVGVGEDGEIFGLF